MVMLGGEPEAKPESAEEADAKKVKNGEKATETEEPAEKKVDFSGLKGLEHCPDFNERFTLVNGRTRAIAYPNPGYNCSN